MSNQYPPGSYPPPDYSMYPPAHNPPPNRSAQILATTAAVVAVIAAGVVIYLFVRTDDEPAAEPSASSVVTVTSHQEAPGQPDPGTAAPPVVPPVVTTTTTTADSGAIPVNGANRQGFYTGPNCDASEDPAVFVGYTSRSRVVVCQVGNQTGRYYYKGLAGGNSIHIDYPTRSGSTFTAVNGSTSYIVSPSSLRITQNGSTIANESMVQSWVN